MVYLRVVGAIALLGFLAACDDSRAPTGGPTPLMDVGPTPVVLRQGEVLRDANGNIFAQAFTTAQAIEYLEARAAEDPEFLGTPLESRSDVGITTTLTFREILNRLKAQSQGYAARPRQAGALNLLSGPPRVVNYRTLTAGGFPGSMVPVAAEMDVDPPYPSVGEYDAVQELTTTGIAPQPIVFTYIKGFQEQFPWLVIGNVEATELCDYRVDTIHSVYGSDGSANAHSSDTGSIFSPPDW